MPSDEQPADRDTADRNYDVERLKRDIGEDPGRFLDRSLFEHGITRLQRRESPGRRQGHQRVVRDADVSAPGQMIRDRIAGIVQLDVARAWLAVERVLERTPEGGRDVVVDLLEQRIAELQEHGERDLPGRSRGEKRGLNDNYELPEKGDVVYRGPDGEETSRSKGSSASQKLAADGGDSA